jgi:hypothetical protein
MTVTEAIKALERLRDLHGSETKVYFDCPTCRVSFTPDLASAERRVVVVAKGQKQP